MKQNLVTNAKGKVEFLLKAVEGLGYTKVGVLDIPSGEAAKWMKSRPHIQFFKFDSSNKELCADDYSVPNATIPEFLAEAARRKLELSPEIMPLNSAYKAAVTRDEVTVGCQTFEADKVLAVADKIRELRGK